MSKQHLIDQTVFDIAFDNETIAYELQSELDTFVKKALMLVVDDEFNRAFPADTDIRISNLDIDLGSIPYGDFQHEMPRRLREQLKDRLDEIRLSLKSGTASNQEVAVSRGSQSDQLVFFLLHGYLPWYSRLQGQAALEKLLLHTLRTAGGEFRRFLQQTAYKDVVMQRLVKQFPEALVGQVFGLLSPLHASQVEDNMSGLQQAMAEKGLIATGLIQQVWLQLIESVLKADSAQLSAEQLFGQMLSSVLGADGRLLTVFSSLASAKIEQHTNSAGLETILQGVMKNLAAQNKKAAVTEKPVYDHAGNNAKQDSLQTMLVSAILSGNSSAIEPIWHELTTNQKTLLDRMLRKLGQQVEVRKKIAYGFSEAVLQDILLVLEPLESGIVRSIIDQTEIFRTDEQGQPETGAKIRKQLWEFSLGYLLVERGSRFNKKSYLQSLIRQMATSRCISYSKLLLDLSESLACLSETSASLRQIQQLLSELAQEQLQDSHSRKVNKQNDNNVYAHYDFLKQAISYGVAGPDQGEAALEKTVETLVHASPWLLMKLFRQLQAGEVVISTRLPVTVSRRLVSVFFMLANQSGATDQVELKQAINHFSHQAVDLNGYYRKILLCLVKGELIDFERLLTEGNQDVPREHERKVQSSPADLLLPDNQAGVKQADQFSPEKQAGADQAERLSLDNRVHSERAERFEAEKRVEAERTNQLQTKTTAYTDKKYEKIVLDYLAAIGSSSEADNQAFVFAVERMLSQPFQLVRRFMLSVLADKKQMERLIVSLPERLLSQILTVIGMSEHARLQQCAELMTAACYAKEIVSNPAGLNTFKWQCIFNYLTEIGPLYNVPLFVSRFVAALVKQFGNGDFKTCRTLLIQEIQNNQLPTTEFMSARIIELLSGHETMEGALEIDGQISSVNPVDTTDIEELPLEQVYINNAGLVLASPYLPRLFEMLGLTENKAFKDRAAAVRAVHMLEFLVNESTSSSESQLVLNKLICGVKNSVPIEREISITTQEKQQLESLLQGMIKNWKSLGSTSIAGLRESFLQRHGKLQLKDDAWYLQVEPKAFDMLLDQIPWGFSTIKYPWMERVIYVEWR